MIERNDEESRESACARPRDCVYSTSVSARARERIESRGEKVFISNEDKKKKKTVHYRRLVRLNPLSKYVLSNLRM